MNIASYAGVPFSVLYGPELEGYHCSGVYMFVRREWNGSATILYIGESADMAQRWTNHEKWDAAVALGMNEIHVHLLAQTDLERLRVETYLRSQFATPLNLQNALERASYVNHL